MCVGNDSSLILWNARTGTVQLSSCASTGNFSSIASLQGEVWPHDSAGNQLLRFYNGTRLISVGSVHHHRSL
ncbi:hypothetical protein C5167_047889 [Papaver somniferum]|uniref:Uncharacterized protein n=1 Tax=Papaver somniferum TaxID=3469 RepID=A0A4Y7LM18_PAPSO|nr:hypothetical protein C5167_047889 [Papaver somniferum]